MLYVGMVLAVLFLGALFINITFHINAKLETSPFMLEFEVRTVWVRITRQYYGDCFYLWAGNILERHQAAKRPRVLSISDYNRLLQQGFKHLVVQKMNWNTVMGLEDAMQTALGVGSLWALKGSLAAWISSHSHVHELNLEILTDFSRPACQTHLSCILKMRMVHIISIIIQAAGLYVRGYMRGSTAGKTKPSH